VDVRSIATAHGQSLQQPFTAINRLVQLLDCMSPFGASQRKQLVSFAVSVSTQRIS
jgi:hypothetical protein